MKPATLASWGSFALLALANLFWAGNWVVGRALRDVYPPVTLNFWRWLIAALILAPFALPLMRGKWRLARHHTALLLVLAASGGALFQSFVYLGVQSTATVNAVLLSSSGPLFVMVCSWLLALEKASLRQVLGTLVSLAGILVIVGRGDPASLLRLDIHAGDAWILLAMPVWGIYSALLKRLPAELRGTFFLFVMAAVTAAMLAPALILEAPVPGARPLAPAALAGLAYVAIFASVLAFTCWNRAVAAVGPNVAGLSLHMMPLFGTMLAVIFLKEELRGFHVVGMAVILSGIAVATWAPGKVARMWARRQQEHTP